MPPFCRYILSFQIYVLWYKLKKGEPTLSVDSPNIDQHKKSALLSSKALFGAPSGTRTQDPLIKSQLLYQTTNTKRRASFPSQIITLHKDESSLQPTICNFPLAIVWKAISIHKDK